MNQKSLTSTFLVCLFLASCSSEKNPQIVAPNFITATLPPTSTPISQPQVETTPLPPTPLPTLNPVSGSTTTQVNVRAEPSTAGESLGEIPPFTQVKIFGQESFGKWFLVDFPSSPNGKGWAAAKFVQVNDPAEIPAVETGAGQGAAGSGLVLRGINVRTGPDSTYESLGTLLPDDIVSIFAKDANNAWLQIQYKGDTGWVSSEFVQMENVDAVPVMAEETQAPEVAATLSLSQPIASDGDSMQAPLTSAMLTLAGIHAIQFSGEVSATDTEDWLQFSTEVPSLAVDVKCASNVVAVELWNNGSVNEELPCGERRVLSLQSGIYLLKFQLRSSDATQGVYTVKIRILR